MTKEAYLEMCEQMGEEPDPERIPIEVTDLSQQTQTALYIMGMLPDNIGEMSGTYLGKDFTALLSLYKILEVDKRDWLLYTDLINHCVRCYKEVISEKQTQQRKLSEAKVKKEGVNING